MALPRVVFGVVSAFKLGYENQLTRKRPLGHLTPLWLDCNRLTRIAACSLNVITSTALVFGRFSPSLIVGETMLRLLLIANAAVAPAQVPLKIKIMLIAIEIFNLISLGFISNQNVESLSAIFSIQVLHYLPSVLLASSVVSTTLEVLCRNWLHSYHENYAYPFSPTARPQLTIYTTDALHALEEQESAYEDPQKWPEDLIQLPYMPRTFIRNFRANFMVKRHISYVSDYPQIDSRSSP